MVRCAFPRGRVVRVQPLAGGLRNGNFKLTLDSTTEPIVLRVYEHDASLCRKEADLIRLVGGSVPVPEVILAEPAGEDHRPFMLQRYVEGPTFRALAGNAKSEEVAEAARSVGETLAAIGAVTFANPGWLAPGPTVTDPLLPGSDPMPRFVDQCLASPKVRRRVPAELRDKTQVAMWSHASALHRAAGETSLVHGDFSRRNLILRQLAGRWVVAAVLDWEFAVSSSPLAPRNASLARRFGPSPPLHDLASQNSASLRSAAQAPSRRWALPAVRAERPPGRRAAFPRRVSGGRWPIAAGMAPPRKTRRSGRALRGADARRAAPCRDRRGGGADPRDR